MGDSMNRNDSEKDVSWKRSRGTRFHATSPPLHVNAQEYFVERDGEAFRNVFAKALKLGQLIFDDEVVVGEGGKGALVRLVTKPELGNWVPAKLRNAVASSSDIEFHDDIEYVMEDITRGPYRLHIHTRSPFLGKRFRLHSTLTITPLDAGRCVQTLEGEVEVKMLGFGGLIERMVRDSVCTTYQKLPEVIDLWKEARKRVVDEHGVQGLMAGRPPHIDCGVAWIKEFIDGIGPNERQTESNEKTGGSIEHVKAKGLNATSDYHVWKAGDGQDSVSGEVVAMTGRDDSKILSYTRIVWRETVDLFRVMFIVTLFLLLRLGIIRVERSPRLTESKRGHGRTSGWNTVVKAQASNHHDRNLHRNRRSYDSGAPEQLVKATHIRRRSRT